MSMQKVKSKKDALISIIKSIRQEMKDGIMKRKIEASTVNVSDEVSSIANNDVDKEDDNTSDTTPCLLPKELAPGKKKNKFDMNSHQSIEKIYMVSIRQEEKTFNPLKIGIDLFSYESPACLQFEQKTRSYGTLNLRDEIAGPVSLSPDRKGLVKRWHICKPIHVTYDDGSRKDCGMWPTCDPDSKFCFGYDEIFRVNEHGTLRQWICFRNHERRDVKGSYMGFADFIQDPYIDNLIRSLPLQYKQSNTNTTGTLRARKNKLQPIRPRPCDYSFEEWLEIRIGHNNLPESDREFIFNEWILDSYDVKEEYAKEIGNPYSKRFDEYNKVFNNEIKHLSNEYILRIGKKGYVLDDVWEKCEQYYKKTNEAWHNEGYKEDEMWRSGDEKTDYDLPYVIIKTFEVNKYSFKGGHSFVCITDREDDALPLGRVNGARFKAMIKKELEDSKYVHKMT
ncbi:hypothetical protein Tco_0759604 [Tanacetum coccineum]